MTIMEARATITSIMAGLKLPVHLRGVINGLVMAMPDETVIEMVDLWGEALEALSETERGRAVLERFGLTYADNHHTR